MILRLNYNLGAVGGAIAFGDGNGGTVGSVDAVGNPTTHVLGTFTADSKAFLIPHPLDAAKDLLHGCLEGPEHSVFYRGEVALVDGHAEVTLPDYFEALTFEEDRSVLLTQVDDDKPLAMLAAGRIRGGKFRIRSSVDDAVVAWEVKAARRAGVEGRLEIVRPRRKSEEAPQEKMPDGQRKRTKRN